MIILIPFLEVQELSGLSPHQRAPETEHALQPPRHLLPPLDPAKSLLRLCRGVTLVHIRHWSERY
jgi:hypothetical protein